MIYDNANEIIGELFKSLPSRYKNNLATSMRGSDCMFLSCHVRFSE